MNEYETERQNFMIWKLREQINEKNKQLKSVKSTVRTLQKLLNSGMFVVSTEDVINNLKAAL